MRSGIFRTNRGRPRTTTVTYVHTPSLPGRGRPEVHVRLFSQPPQGCRHRQVLDYLILSYTEPGHQHLPRTTAQAETKVVGVNTLLNQNEEVDEANDLENRKNFVKS